MCALCVYVVTPVCVCALCLYVVTPVFVCIVGVCSYTCVCALCVYVVTPVFGLNAATAGLLPLPPSASLQIGAAGIRYFLDMKPIRFFDDVVDIKGDNDVAWS